MIDFISGKIVAIELDGVIIQVGNYGVKLITPKDVVRNFQVGDEGTFSTHLHVREDVLQLYGFTSSEQRTCFEMLLKVTGIGPRIALSILSNLSLQTFYSAVRDNQASLLSEVPGVGKKTASKIILFLQDKLVPPNTLDAASFENTMDYEVVQVLLSLGYTVLEAQSAIQSIPQSTPMEMEARVQAALRHFSR